MSTLSVGPAALEDPLHAALLAVLEVAGLEGATPGGARDEHGERAARQGPAPHAFAWMGCLGLAAPESLEPLFGAIAARLFDKRTPFARRASLAASMATAQAPWTAELVERLDAGDDEDRAVAARALAAPRHLEAVPSLVRALGDGRAAAAVRVAAAEALSAIGDASVGAALLEALGDVAAEVRRAAVVALRALDPTRRSAPAFLSACEDVDVDVRCAGLAALLVVGGTPAARAARAALDDEEGAVRALALVVLSRHGAARDAALLRRHVEDHDARVRRAAREALRRLQA
jgi:hypothetical protein